MAIYKEDIVDIELTSGTIHRSFLNHSIGKADDMADRFGFRLFRNGEVVSTENCSVQGYFMAPNGVNIAITGADNTGKVGNVAWVQLPQACYNEEGQFSLAIKLVGGGVTGTVRIIDGNVNNTGATGAVAPVADIPTYQEILGVYDEMLEATLEAKAGILTELERKGIYTETGEEFDSTIKVSSGYIHCYMSDKFEVTKKVPMESNTIRVHFLFYDEELNYIERLTCASQLTSEENVERINTFSPGSFYVRIMFTETADNTELTVEDVVEKFSVKIYDMTTSPATEEQKSYDGLIACDWAYGSLFVETGSPYVSYERAITRAIEATPGETINILNPQRMTYRVYKFDTDGEYIEYNETAREQNYIVEDNVGYIIINGIDISSLEDVANNILVRTKNNVITKINDKSFRDAGLIDCDWYRGGILVASGEDTTTATRIKTGMIKVPENHKICASLPDNKYIIRAFAYTEDDGEILYLPGVDGIAGSNYTTSICLLLKDEIKYVRFQIRVNEDPETTVIDTTNASEIAIYSTPNVQEYTYNDEYADYAINEANAVSNRLDSYAVQNPFTFIAVSDMHYWYNNDVVKRSLLDMKNGADYLKFLQNFDFGIDFGDHIYRWYSEYLYSEGKNEMVGIAKLLDDVFKDMAQIRIVGNHDSNSLEKNKYFTMEELYKYIGSYSEITADSMNATGCYGYTDLTDKKIRIVVLNTSDYSDEGAPQFIATEENENVNSVSAYMMSSRQVQWFKEIIKLTDIEDAENWNLIVMSHIPIDDSSGRLYQNVGANVFDFLTERKAKSSGVRQIKGNWMTYDYTDCEDLNSIVYVHGHEHNYDLAAKSGIMKIGIPNALPYRNDTHPEIAKVVLTKDSTAFCVLKFDFANKMLYAIHYGKGYDRIVHFNPVKLDSSLTVESVLGNGVEWSSTAQSVATVSNGVITPVGSGYALIKAVDDELNVESWNVYVE